MEKSNKQVIDEMTDYFLKSDPELVARLLANCMIDFNRMANIEYLDYEESSSLMYRVHNNAEQVVNFAKFGDRGPLKLYKYEEDKKDV